MTSRIRLPDLIRAEKKVDREDQASFFWLIVGVKIKKKERIKKKPTHNAPMSWIAGGILDIIMMYP